MSPDVDEMETWRVDIDRGIHFLSRHAAKESLGCFTKALEKCPVSEKRELAIILYYLGVALERLGFVDCAVKSWIASLRLRKNQHTLKMIHRFSNSYGMSSQGCQELDDWRAFYAYHLGRYLRSKKARRLSNDAERDMIRDLIGDAWKDLKASRLVEGMSAEHKSRVFQQVKIFFPNPESVVDSVVHVDFHEGKRVAPNDRCPCGSGLPFMSCCGRTPGERELLSGSI